jgi:ubiquinone biosynthesis protein Coq4
MRSKDSFHYSHEELHQFPDGTLGKDLANHLSKHNFSLLKNYERHDCKHLILGFPMDELGEASMQFYLLGTKHYSFPTLLTVSVCIFIMPDYWGQLFHSYKRGSQSPRLEGIDYNQVVHEQTEHLIQKYQIN